MLENGQQIGHYKILSAIGAGGMGEVFLAEDSRLGRKVALKLLPAKISADAHALDRFKQEARAASALNHPNIITIHDIGEEGGKHFIAAEFIEGQTLRERMKKRLTFDETLSIRLLFCEFCQSEIQNFHVTVFANHHIFGFDVAMDDSSFVRRRKSFCRLN